MSTAGEERETGEHPRASKPRLFREEAWRHHVREREFGDVLRMPPRWTRFSYPLLVVMVLFGVILLGVGRVSQYASGPAVIRAEGRQNVVSTVAGTVAEVAVGPGDAVSQGEVLVRMHAEPEESSLARVRAEFETLLADRLRDPSSEATRRALLSLRAELELARARVDAKTLRAPRAGVVQEVRVREGHSVREGDLLVSLAPEGARYTLIALLPASALPELRTGMPLRVEMAGYPGASVSVRIEHLGDQAAGPAEARRVLGTAISDTVDVSGAVVIARARLPGATFRAIDGEYRYHDGMVTAAETPIRTERLLFALFPGLRAALVD